MKKSLVVVLVCGALLSGCSSSRPDLKSPCVGADDSPCGPKRGVNNV